MRRWEGQVDIGAIREDDSRYGIFDPKKYTTHGQYAENGVKGPAICGAQDKAGRYMSRGGPSLQYRHADYSLVDTGKHSYHKINEDDDAESAADAFVRDRIHILRRSVGGNKFSLPWVSTNAPVWSRRSDLIGVSIIKID